MTLEAHVVTPPAWMVALVDQVVLPAVVPYGPMGCLGYRWWHPGAADNAFDGWQVAVYPLAAEVKSERYDGGLLISGFNLEIQRILAAFAAVESVVWRAAARYNEPLEGPSIDVQGTFLGERLVLRVFPLPPPDEPPSHYLDPKTGDVWGTPA